MLLAVRFQESMDDWRLESDRLDSVIDIDEREWERANAIAGRRGVAGNERAAAAPSALLAGGGTSSGHRLRHAAIMYAEFL